MFLECLNKVKIKSILTRKLAKGVLDLVVEVLVELGTLDETVAQTSFLMGQQLLLIKTDNAGRMALFHGFSSHLVVELVSKLSAEHSQVKPSTLVCRHY